MPFSTMYVLIALAAFGLQKGLPPAVHGVKRAVAAVSHKLHPTQKK